MLTQKFDQREFQNPNMELQAVDDTEEEDSLSFCDLPIYGDTVNSEDFSRELHHQTSSSSASHSQSEDQQYFAFFCEEWSKSPTTKSHQPDENIFFCGKLIPYSRPPLIHYNHNPQYDKVLRWNSKSSDESISFKSNNSKSTSVQFPVHNDGKLDKFNFPGQRVSMLAPPAKSRWYLFMFGLARFPVEMELRDIRRRQSRKSIKSNDMSDINRGKWGLWRMIRSLGCGGQHHSNASIEAAYSCAPQVVR